REEHLRCIRSGARRGPPGRGNLRGRACAAWNSAGIGSPHSGRFLKRCGEFMSLMQELNHKALRLGVPLSVHLDVTYRCNERCEPCYLEHDDRGEMTSAEIKSVLQQLADAGVFFLTISGGEPL